MKKLQQEELARILRLLGLLFCLSVAAGCLDEVGTYTGDEDSNDTAAESGNTEGDSGTDGDDDSGTDGDDDPGTDGDDDSGTDGDDDSGTDGDDDSDTDGDDDSGTDDDDESGTEGDDDSGTNDSIADCGEPAETYSASGIGESAIIVDGGSQLETSKDSDFTETAVYSPSSPAVISNVTITSTSEPEEDSGAQNGDISFYGYNSAVLAKNGGKLELSCATVNISGTGNAVFAFNGAEITLTDVQIEATGKYGHGVDATYGGTIIANNVDIYTTDHHAAGLSTDRGGGNIYAYGGTVTTEGSDSPGIYSTGYIYAEDTIITAIGGGAAVVEGENEAELQDVTLIIYGEDLSDPKAVKLYQSMSGDAGSGYDGVFKMTGGSFTWKRDDGPLFKVSNSNGLAILSGVEIFSDSNVIMEGAYSDKMDEAMTMELVAEDQILTGDFVADNWYGMTIRLDKNAALTGAVNEDDTADSANVHLEATASWAVTANSYVDCVYNADGISGTTISNMSGDSSVYYDTSKCEDLDGITYSFSSGTGSLEPN
jgi:hypothetical protein